MVLFVFSKPCPTRLVEALFGCCCFFEASSFFFIVLFFYGSSLLLLLSVWFLVGCP